MASIHPTFASPRSTPAATDFLREVRALLEVVERLPHPVAFVDRALRYELVNPAYARRVGRSRQDLVGRTLAEVLGEAALARARDDLSRVLDGEVVHETMRLPAADGGEELLDAVLVPRSDAGGGIVGYVAVLTDRTEQHRTATALRETRRILESLVACSSDMIHAVDAEGRVVYASPSVERIVGWPVDEHTRVFDHVAPEDLPRVKAAWAALLGRPGAETSLELSMFTARGATIRVEARARNLLDDPQVRAVVVNTREVTDRHRRERLHRDVSNVLEQVAADVPLASTLDALAALVADHAGGTALVMVRERDGTLAHVATRGAEPSLGASLHGTEWPDVAALRAHVEAHGECAWASGAVTGREVIAVAITRDARGRPPPPVLADAARVGRLGLIRDGLIAELSHRARHDALTGLPNRTLFDEHLRRAVARSARSGQPLAVIFIDLDGFKKVNDTLGHDVGDALLVEVARRFEAITREGDVLARMGGDEFVLLSPDLPDRDVAVRIAQRLRGALAAPVHVDGHEILARASVGVSVCPRDARDPATLLRYADAAMYGAKADGKNDIQCFSPEMMKDAAERLALESRLSRALDRGDLETWMQPQVDLRTGRPVGIEALSRWHDPERGWISPGVFIPVAMEAGLMVDLGRHVLRESCRTLRRFEAEMPDELDGVRVAVNVAAPQLHHAGFVDDVRRILEETGLAAERLELEITESAVIRDVDRVIACLEELRAAGVRISLDDFGTGYSSLTYLRRLPVDCVKIDKSFIDPIETDHVAAGIASTIVSMAHWLGMTVVAEGVETAAQAELLLGAGCDVAQGYYFARPVPPAKLGACFAAPRLPLEG
ncbi:MAG TPA: EAL domain-containing protein [Sandaracinaceae bacterium LLY-WYZ-13_1]|nr:EAL domain-containing protein [Sandaracinaceae bacterium LLY-WYZ-13_1]